MFRKVFNQLVLVLSIIPKGKILLWIDVLIIGLAATRSIINWFDLPYEGLITHDFISITVEWKLGEIFQYAKEVGLIIISFLIFKKSKIRVYIKWAILYLYFLLDDSLKIHESLGNLFEGMPDILPAIGLSNESFGELIAYMVFGVIFLIVFISGQKEIPIKYNVNIQILVLFLGLFLFFGVFIDIFIAEIFNSYFAKKALIYLEESGEMIVISLNLWYLISLLRTEKSLI